MWLIHKTIEDAASPRGKVSIALNADQAMTPYSWKPPIHWNGIINNKKVQFIQTSRYASDRDDFDWNGFPEDLAYLRSDIVELIDKAMRTMD